MDNRAIRAEKYRSKAEEVRVIAESMKNSALRAMLLSVAQDYLSLADTMDRMADDGGHLPELADPEL